MRRLLPLALAALPLHAHVISMSSGDLTISGNRAHYELRMPLYELSHIRGADAALLEHIRFTGGGGDAILKGHSCHADAPAATYACSADYVFPAPVDRLEVECTFYRITVPNHVHLLRAVRDGKRDQALLDYSFPRSTLTFRPPTPLEVAVSQMAAGFGRAVGGLVQILFLVSLVLAARSRRELFSLAGMFLAGQAAAVLILPRTGWMPAARFVEAAAALTVAYLAVEILWLPEAGWRWLIVAVLGGFHGLYFVLFLQTSGYQAGYVLAGAAMAEIPLIAVLGLLLSRVGRAAAALKPVQVSASLLLLFGMAWFVLRLRS